MTHHFDLLFFLAQRVELLKNVGSFNVQLAIEERLAIKNLQKLKDRKIISGFGQNRFGSIYVALDKENGGFSGGSGEEGDTAYENALNASNVNTNISDTDDSPNSNSKRSGSGANTDREYIILNSPVLDSKLQHADDFRKLKMSARIFVHKNPTTRKYCVAELDSELFYRLNGPSCREILMRMNSAPITSKIGVGESWISPLGEKNSGSSSSDGLYFSGRTSYNENRELDQNGVVNGFVKSQSHSLNHQPTNSDYKSALAPRKTISNPNPAENHCKLQDWVNSPSSNSKTNESSCSGSRANGQLVSGPSTMNESPPINNNENGQNLMDNYFTNQPPNIQQIQPDYCEQIANEQMLAEYKAKVINEKLIEDLSHLHLRRPIRDDDIYNNTHAHCDLKFVESNRQQQQELRMKMIRSFENKRSDCGIYNKTGCITHENVRDDVFINAHNPHLAPNGPSSSSKQLATTVINDQNAETSNENSNSNSSVSFASSQNSSYAPYRIGLLPSDRTNSEANNSINGVNDVLNVDIKSYNENKFKESINCSTL